MNGIKLCENKDKANELFQIYEQCRCAMQKEGIFQWQNEYPALETIKQDIEDKTLYGYYENGECLGAVCISAFQDEEYKEIDWQYPNENVIVIHRLAVNPDYQKSGIARVLMNFAEDFAKKENYSSIRLDSYSDNKRALKFYENRGYEKRGECFFVGRDKPFYCYEKKL